LPRFGAFKIFGSTWAKELEERASAVRSNLPRDPAILPGATLVALPLFIYFAFLGAIGMSLFAFSAIVRVLFDLAVKFWPKPVL
jgi:hypothetical protein